MTTTYTALAKTTLTTTASSVVFGSIPSTYRDLVLVCTPAHTTTNVNFFLRFNGDSGSNYRMVRVSGSGTAASSSAPAAATSIDLTFQSDVNTTLNAFNTIANIMDYSTTDKSKTVITRSNRNLGTTGGTDLFVHRWSSTAAITSLTMLPNTGSWAAGSVFSLYGIVA
jgi:hypothetical protein